MHSATRSGQILAELIDFYRVFILLYDLELFMLYFTGETFEGAQEVRSK